MLNLAASTTSAWMGPTRSVVLGDVLLQTLVMRRQLDVIAPR